jgi:hypothetical protein
MTKRSHADSATSAAFSATPTANSRDHAHGNGHGGHEKTCQQSAHDYACLLNPCHYLLDEKVDETFLLCVYDCFICVYRSCECCCDLNANEIYEDVYIIKHIWRMF